MALNPTIAKLMKQEAKRQSATLTLIPSENHVSGAVQKAQASLFTNKYAEGYPGRRYYGGTQFCDELELLCQKQAQTAFKTDYFVNVQAYSGSPANMAIYMGLMNPGDTIMGLDLAAGGHLTHGYKVSASGKIYHSVPYAVDPETHLLDYEAIEKLAIEHKPQVIVTGATAHPRQIDFARFAGIAKKVGAYLVADISHISGLVATGLHPSPFGHADAVMTTTHKMLRGPRGALIFARTEELSTKINKAVFPGLQGGPHMHTIAAITQCLFEASEDSYKQYCQQIINNAKAMTEVFQARGFDLVTGGTENHLWLLDLRSKNVNGHEAQEKLDAQGIIANKNAIPFDPSPPLKPSGIRMGTPAITTRGLKEEECRLLATEICDLLEGKKESTPLIADLTQRFLLPV